MALTALAILAASTAFYATVSISWISVLIFLGFIVAHAILQVLIDEAFRKSDSPLGGDFMSIGLTMFRALWLKWLLAIVFSLTINFLASVMVVVFLVWIVDKDHNQSRPDSHN